MRDGSGDFARIDPSAVWMSARARNALRRPLLIGTISALAFLTALVTLVVAPRGANRARRAAQQAFETRLDTVPALAQRDRGARATVAADSALAMARRLTFRSVPRAMVDTFPPALVARRDTLANAATTLARLIARAQSAPLPASYRALGDARPLAALPAVRALLDSLAEVERERAAFGAVGGVDPIFVALSARVSEIGRSIRVIAESTRMEMQREAATLRMSPPPAAPAIAVLDTQPLVARRDSARRDLEVAIRSLAAVRESNRQAELAAQAARARANVVAPPLAILAAALVLGAVFGFGVALLLEVRRPRVADAREAARHAGERVLGVVRQQPPAPERMRRQSDRVVPPFVEALSESYRQVYGHLAAIGASVPVVTVTGEDSAVVAVVATNIAAVSAYEARGTLLVDAELASGAIAGVLRVRPDPGLDAVLAGAAEWAEAIASRQIGRDRALDVVPAGTRGTRQLEPAAAAALRHGIARMARRYDLVVVSAPMPADNADAATLLPTRDVILCVRAGHTTLRAVSEGARRLRDAGAQLRGVVLWDMDVPTLPSREELAAYFSPRARLERETERAFAPDSV